MPSKKKKYNARFPAGRIKKIMQTDEEVGKVAQAVPVIISKALEMFIESLLKKSSQITQSRNAKTLTPSHMKQCILSESRFDFLKDLVKNIPDASIQEDNENNALAESNVDFGCIREEPGTPVEPRPPPKEKRKSLTYGASSTLVSQETSTSRTPVIQFGPNLSKPDNSKLNFSVDNLLRNTTQEESKLHVTIDSEQLNLQSTSTSQNTPTQSDLSLSATYPAANSGGNLCIDEDYDN